MGSFRIRLSTDLAAGLLFAGLGLVTMYGASRYNLGNAARMGPGFMPMIIGAALTLFGTLAIGQSIVREGEEIGTVELRPVLLVFVGVFCFAMLIDRGGFLLAIASLVICARLAGREVKPIEIAVLAAALALLGAAIFVWGLGLPLPLLPR
jgi:hypothetical protein